MGHKSLKFIAGKTVMKKKRNQSDDFSKSYGESKAEI
jgi:hypothetical protein